MGPSFFAVCTQLYQHAPAAFRVQKANHFAIGARFRLIAQQLEAQCLQAFHFRYYILNSKGDMMNSFALFF